MFCITRHEPEAPARSGAANRVIFGFAVALALVVAVLALAPFGHAGIGHFLAR
jgi:hypothetical protein